jgi:hypothetical protein
MKNKEKIIKDDNVEHPGHYCFGSIEVIDAIEDWNLNFHLSNAIKYIARAGKKNPDKEIEDIQKAIWYLNRYIQWKEKNKKK